MTRGLHSVLTVVAPSARFDDGLRGVDFHAVFDRRLVTAEPERESQCRTDLMTGNDPVEAVPLLQRLGVGVEKDRVSRKEQRIDDVRLSGVICAYEDRDVAVKLELKPLEQPRRFTASSFLRSIGFA